MGAVGVSTIRNTTLGEAAPFSSETLPRTTQLRTSSVQVRFFAHDATQERRYRGLALRVANAINAPG
ncbi:MAG: hypothetical protein HWQ23_05165 [Nostoc sp. JL33]|nr:hypothetical protein [Nostoc commune BAE]MBN3869706.1 hypothetical protein [Nostoc sp. JL33]